MTRASLREYAAVQQVGDRFSDETGEWNVVSQPYTTAGGKNAHARVRRVDQPAVVGERTWGAHEHITVRRAMSVVRRSQGCEPVEFIAVSALCSESELFPTSAHAVRGWN